MESTLNTDQLIASLENKQAQYNSLLNKVKEYLTAVENCKKNNNAAVYFHQKCNIEKDLKKIINPEKSSQTAFEWMAK